MPSNKPTPLALVGGFLGAGKTTLLLRAAGLLRERGLRAAILTNDQGGELVDTRLAAAGGFDTGEIPGGCFCCRFSEFLRCAESLHASNPDIVFAEPVGSCMDLAATVLEPLRRLHPDRFHIAPFTVLVDPARAAEMLGPAADPDLAYLFRNQLAEADLVYFTKTDLHPDCPEIPGGAAGRLSGRTGAGVADWLALLLSGNHASGARILDIDYKRYASAEASLGWLNWHARLATRAPLAPALVAGPLLDALDSKLTAAGAAIMHLKLLDQTPTGYIRASICRNGDEPLVDGDLSASATARHELVLNLRALAAPELLQAIVDEAAAELPGDLTVLHRQAFRLAPPVPEFRFTG